MPAAAPQNLLEQPAPELVSAPPLERRLPVWPAGRPAGAGGEAGWWLLGVHGGAGVTCLRRPGVGGGDAERRWPVGGLVVAVARGSACGLEWARDAARQHASGGVPVGVVLAGLVVVADAPGRTPVRLARFADLVAGAFPRVWEVPWVAEWRLAGYEEPVACPPAVRQLDRDMQALVGGQAGVEEKR